MSATETAIHPCPYSYTQFQRKDFDKTTLKNFQPLMPILPN